jgi:hypothetical protein
MAILQRRHESISGARARAEVVQGTACAESQSDGIPDAWKTKFGLSTTNSTLYKTIDPVTGYPYLDDYLNGLLS